MVEITVKNKKAFVFIDFYFWFLAATAFLLLGMALFFNSTSALGDYIARSEKTGQYITLEKTILRDLSHGPVKVDVYSDRFEIGDKVYRVDGGNLVYEHDGKKKVLVEKTEIEKAEIQAENGSEYLCLKLSSSNFNVPLVEYDRKFKISSP